MLIKNTTYQCLVTTTVLNTKINEVENKIPNTSNLVTTTILNTKISEFKKLTTENVTPKLKQMNLEIQKKLNRHIKKVNF